MRKVGIRVIPSPTNSDDLTHIKPFSISLDLVCDFFRTSAQPSKDSNIRIHADFLFCSKDAMEVSTGSILRHYTTQSKTPECLKSAIR